MKVNDEIAYNRRRTDVVAEIEDYDRIAITVRSHKLLKKLLRENPKLEEIMHVAKNETEALLGVREWIFDILKKNPHAAEFYHSKHTDRELFEKLNWSDYAAIRILDYIDNAGRTFEDLNLRGALAVSNPVKLIWLAVNHGTGGAKPGFFEDMIELFRQMESKNEPGKPTKTTIEKWMKRYPSGLDPRIIKLREENRERIIYTLIRKMDSGEITDSIYHFKPELSQEQKFLQMLSWWNESRFHLHFAVRSADLLNEMLGDSLDPDTMEVLYQAEKAGIPFFVNPYYLSLLHVRVPYFAIGADLAIRHYVVYTKSLVEEFGNIVAWEKEDKVQPGKPNAAGWILPSDHNIHRRYPDVAILIPDTVGRACGGLCSSCQRMYDFQSGRLNFDLEKLKPRKPWREKLPQLMEYFRRDTQLRDILITGGDALMSSDKSLQEMLDAVYEMALQKKEDNKKRPDGEKYAEILRIRLGTRLPIYLPQRVTPELIEILQTFRERARKIGIRQFVIQTHYESPMEVTPESKKAIQSFLNAGWMVTNQLVFTAAASRRGHTAKLRSVLNDIGVLSYYTFTVKGYMENNFNFAPNARVMQEQIEEKQTGMIPDEYSDRIAILPEEPQKMIEYISQLRRELNTSFLATDRNVLNLPGVGKSLTYRVIGITRYGRRILEFDHDPTRTHSPIIHKMGKIVVIESKSISEYLQQLEELGEDISEYSGLYGYSIGETEKRAVLYEYPEYDFQISAELTNLEIEE